MATPATRENIMIALQKQLSSLGFFNTLSRRNVNPENIGVNDSPALFLIEHSEHHTGRPTLPVSLRVINVWLAGYSTIGADNDAIPASGINAILDAIETALAPDPGGGTGRCTLGGLVYAVEIDGEIIRALGDLTGQSAVFVPVKITRP